MSVRLLKTFVAIAETGSFAGAAAKVFVTQAAVSQQMKRLEDLLQTQLFERNHRSPILTQAARAMVPQARDVIQRYDQMVAAATSKSAMAGDIRIGAVPSVMANLVPPALKQIKRAFPGVHIRVVPSLSSDLLTQVERGTIDAAVMSKPDRFRTTLKWLPVAQEQLMLAVSTQVEGHDARAILLSEPYLRMAQNAWISLLADEVLAELSLSLIDTMELDSLETIASMVAHNLGVAVIPKPCVHGVFASAVRYIPVGSQDRFREIGILSRADNREYPIIEAFHASVKSICD